jgi:hypothetical protein
MIFQAIGYAAFVIFGLGLLGNCGLMLFFGGGDCGPLFGNWYHKGSRMYFFVFLAITIAIWYLIIASFPFNVSINVS